MYLSKYKFSGSNSIAVTNRGCYAILAKIFKQLHAKEEVERLNLCEGQLLAIEIHPSEIDSAIPTDVGIAFDESWQRNEPGYRYLAEH